MNHKIKELFEKELNVKKIEKWMKHHTIQDLKGVVFENSAEEEASKILTLIHDLDDIGRDMGMQDYNDEIMDFDAADKKISQEA